MHKIMTNEAQFICAWKEECIQCYLYKLNLIIQLIFFNIL